MRQKNPSLGGYREHSLLASSAHRKIKVLCANIYLFYTSKQTHRTEVDCVARLGHGLMEACLNYILAHANTWNCVPCTYHGGYQAIFFRSMACKYGSMGALLLQLSKGLSDFRCASSDQNNFISYRQVMPPNSDNSIAINFPLITITISSFPGSNNQFCTSLYRCRCASSTRSTNRCQN